MTIDMSLLIRLLIPLHIEAGFNYTEGFYRFEHSYNITFVEKAKFCLIYQLRIAKLRGPVIYRHSSNTLKSSTKLFSSHSFHKNVEQ